MGSLYTGPIFEWLSSSPEEICRHAQPDCHHSSAQKWLGNFSCQARRGVAADGAGDHGQQAITPNHLAIDHEKHEGYTVSHRGGNDLQRIDLVQILVAEKRQQGDDQKSGAGTEVADIETDDHRENEHGNEMGLVHFAALGCLLETKLATLKPTRNRPTERKDDFCN